MWLMLCYHVLRMREEWDIHEFPRHVQRIRPAVATQEQDRAQRRFCNEPVGPNRSQNEGGRQEERCASDVRHTYALANAMGAKLGILLGDVFKEMTDGSDVEGDEYFRIDPLDRKLLWRTTPHHKQFQCRPMGSLLLISVLKFVAFLAVVLVAAIMLVYADDV